MTGYSCHMAMHDIAFLSMMHLPSSLFYLSFPIISYILPKYVHNGVKFEENGEEINIIHWLARIKMNEKKENYNLVCGTNKQQQAQEFLL